MVFAIRGFILGNMIGNGYKITNPGGIRKFLSILKNIDQKHPFLAVIMQIIIIISTQNKHDGVVFASRGIIFGNMIENGHKITNPGGIRKSLSIWENIDRKHPFLGRYYADYYYYQRKTNTTEWFLSVGCLYSGIR